MKRRKKNKKYNKKNSELMAGYKRPTSKTITQSMCVLCCVLSEEQVGLLYRAKLETLTASFIIISHPKKISTT